jgi:hypothetical protein
MVYKELCLHESWADEHGECSHKYVLLGVWNIKKASFSEEIGSNTCSKWNLGKSSTRLRNFVSFTLNLLWSTWGKMGKS